MLVASNENFSDRGKLYQFISGQHGGYWRHDFVDHAYLYNLYFPPEPFFDQFKEQIHELVLNYPLAQDALARLMGELINQSPENIVVGNGAAELIKIVSGQMAKRLIVPVPSFNEYGNAAPAGHVIEFALDPPSFQLDVDKFAAEAVSRRADMAVVVTPNNPTSLAVPKEDIVRLLINLADHDCMLIVDESFIDFVGDPAAETLENEIGRHPNLAIFKSMSKAYGICGIRIGYMLTANSDFAARVRRGVPIWNVNGFAETFLMLAPQYRQEFRAGCDRVRADRDQCYRQLSSIQGLTAFQPEANFIFCRLPEWAASGPEITRKLFIKHNIYIKHCQGKTMPQADRYLRLACRTEDENRKMVEALRDVIGSESKP